MTTTRKDEAPRMAAVDNIVSLDARRATPPGRCEAEQAAGGRSSAAARPGDLSGEANQNPPGMGLIELVAEDFRTHDRDPSQAGFWVMAVHRFGNWRMSIRPRKLRQPLSAAYRLLYEGVTWATGIDVPYSVKMGRRVRFWHHGGTVISARAVGDDVHFRHNTTVGVAKRDAPMDDKPVIGDRVDVGVGAVIVGPIEIGSDTVIGANAVVVRSCGEAETLVGIPARPMGRRMASG